MFSKGEMLKWDAKNGVSLMHQPHPRLPLSTLFHDAAQ